MEKRWNTRRLIIGIVEKNALRVISGRIGGQKRNK